MNENQELKGVANFVAAFAHLVCGEGDRSEEFRSRTRLVITGSRPSLDVLQQHMQHVKEDGLPYIWICVNEEASSVPIVGLVARIDDKLHVAEECMLWSATRTSKAKLVPSSFQHGAFSFDDNLQLTYSLKAPRNSQKFGMDGIEKACIRLGEIAHQQMTQGASFELPERIRAA